MASAPTTVERRFSGGYDPGTGGGGSATCRRRRTSSADYESLLVPPPRSNHKYTARRGDGFHRTKHYKTKAARSATLSPTPSKERKWSSDKLVREQPPTQELQHSVMFSASSANMLETIARISSISASNCTANVQKKPELPRFVLNGPLRKTNSMPLDLYDSDGDHYNVERIQNVLNSLRYLSFSNDHSRTTDAFGSTASCQPCNTDTLSVKSNTDEAWATPRGSLMTTANEFSSSSSSESNYVITDIEELKEAAKTIGVLSRRNKRRQKTTASTDFNASMPDEPLDSGIRRQSFNVPVMKVEPPISPRRSASTLPRRSGITTRLGGQPRGVIQFLPSIKTSELMSKTPYQTYMANKYRREQMCTAAEEEYQASMSHAYSPDAYLGSDLPPLSDRPCYSGMDHPIRNGSPGGSMNLNGYYTHTTTSLSPELLCPDLDESFTAHKDVQNSPRKYSMSEKHGSYSPSYGLSRSPGFSGQRRHSSGVQQGLCVQGMSSSTSVSPADGRLGRLSLTRGSLGNSEATMIADELHTTTDSDDGLSFSDSVSDLDQREVQDSGSESFLSDSDSSLFRADLYLWQRRSNNSIRKHQDARAYVVREILETESSYVENLNLLVHKYLRPLKRPELCSLIEPGLLNTIFFQIPEILGHHELLYSALKTRIERWDYRTKVGDIILNSFTKQSMIDTYTAFINNWRNARMSIRSACCAKPAFAKYLERCSREHKNRLTLDALLIMPVQRIPRYKLLIKELLKHTSVEHVDYPLLLRAEKEIHELATKIDQIQTEVGLAEQMQQRLREVEAIVEGLDDLVSFNRSFIRYDLVTVTTPNGAKERCFFLFSDLLVITTVKRRHATSSRKGYQNFLEQHKFKLLMKVSLEDLNITENNISSINKVKEDIRMLQEDLRVLSKVYELTMLLKSEHKSIEKELENSTDSIRIQLSQKHEDMATNPLLTSLQMSITTEVGIEQFTVTFQNAEKRLGWEKTFVEAKEVLVLLQSQRQPPEFVRYFAAQRCQQGFQTYTCAVCVQGRNHFGHSDVWICESDTFGGQLCIMTFSPEFDVSSINAITKSPVSCICVVPESIREAKYHNETSSNSSFGQLSNTAAESGKEGQPFYFQTKLESDSSDNESSAESTKLAENGITMNDASSPTPGSKPVSDTTVWIAAADGTILIYNPKECVRTGKSKKQIQLSDAVHCMTYYEDRMFISLSGGDLICYERDGPWDTHQSKQVCVGKFGVINTMTVVTGRLWCGCRNLVLIVNPLFLKQEHAFPVNSDKNSSIKCIVTSALSVWLAIENSAVTKLYHAHNFSCLMEVNISPTVTKALAGCDDIIRQHKLSCLRITSMLCCKDLLWVGTSAGVLVHIPIPHVNHFTTKVTSVRNISYASVGHSGPCRFLVSVDLNESSLDGHMTNKGNLCSSELRRRRTSLNIASLQQKMVYVISGGEGCEDLQDTTSDENDDSFGVDDSTNFLLMWKT